jgi:hypothetical protein
MNESLTYVGLVAKKGQRVQNENFGASDRSATKRINRQISEKNGHSESYQQRDQIGRIFAY